ncbi:hypothetical protein [Flavobacterium sp. LAR06]|uniref:hypothetical protein n=1 Tax=Flavobacterium sp. LAR06 TaxID=3064897 RepID=UPI0035C17F54
MGSPEAKHVERPLPIMISCNKDQVTTVTPEVLSVGDLTPDAFGYFTFSFEVIEVLKAKVATYLDNIITSANLKIYANDADGRELFSGDLNASLNTIKVKGDTNFTYYIVVSKHGFSDIVLTKTYSEMKDYETNPLIITFRTMPILPKRAERKIVGHPHLTYFYEYDDNNSIIKWRAYHGSIQIPNESVFHSQCIFEYNSNGHVLSKIFNSVDESTTYYPNASNYVNVLEGTRSWRYHLDEQSRLSTVEAPTMSRPDHTYSYDVLGNLAKVQSAYHSDEHRTYRYERNITHPFYNLNTTYLWEKQFILQSMNLGFNYATGIGMFTQYEYRASGVSVNDDPIIIEQDGLVSEIQVTNGTYKFFY